MQVVKGSKVSFAENHSADQTCVLQVLLFAAGLLFFGLGLLTEEMDHSGLGLGLKVVV